MAVRKIKKEELDRVAYIVGIAFSMDDKKLELWKKNVDIDTIRVYEEDEEIRSVFLFLPFETFIRGALLKAGGVAYVGTPPEHRNRGYIRELMRGVLKEAYEEGIAISYLFPFSYEFYRKFGYEHCGDYKLVSFEPEDVKAQLREGYRVNPAGLGDIPTLNRIYESFIRRYSCGIRRSERWWKKEILEPELHFPGKRWVYIIEKEGDEPCGYVVFSLEMKKEFQRHLKVKDFAFKEPEAFHVLLSFLSNMRSQVMRVDISCPLDLDIEGLLAHPGRERKLLQGFMARIVNLKSALQGIEYRVDGRLEIEIVDPLIDENNGCFELRVENGTGSVKRADRCVVKMSIGALTSLFTGFKSFEDLIFEGKIEVENERAKLLGDFFPKRTTYLADYF